MKAKFTFDAEALKKAVREQITASYKSQISAAIAKEECPEHHQHANITFSGDLENLTIHITACCQPFIDSLQAGYGKKS